LEELIAPDPTEQSSQVSTTAEQDSAAFAFSGCGVAGIDLRGKEPFWILKDVDLI
jgi:hypothetical protein